MSSSHAPAIVPPTDRRAAVPAGHCLNCHHRLAGPFCHHCGQAAHTPARITVHHLLHEVPHTIWHLDHGLVHNVREMVLRPGVTMQRYLAGERKPFFNPLSLLVLVGGISAFLFTKLHIVPMAENQPGVPPRVAHVQHELYTIIQRFQAWLSILLLPISASLATPLLRRSTGYTWAEQLVASALLSGAVAVVGCAFIPLLAYWSGQPQTQTVGLVMAVLMIVYKGWGYSQLQVVQGSPDRAAKRWFRGLLIGVGEYLGLMLVVAVVGFVMLLQMLKHS